MDKQPSEECHRCEALIQEFLFYSSFKNSTGARYILFAENIRTQIIGFHPTLLN